MSLKFFRKEYPQNREYNLLLTEIYQMLEIKEVQKDVKSLIFQDQEEIALVCVQMINLSAKIH